MIFPPAQTRDVVTKDLPLSMCDGAVLLAGYYTPRGCEFQPQVRVSVRGPVGGQQTRTGDLGLRIGLRASLATVGATQPLRGGVLGRLGGTHGSHPHGALRYVARAAPAQALPARISRGGRVAEGVEAEGYAPRRSMPGLLQQCQGYSCSNLLLSGGEVLRGCESRQLE